MHPFPRALPLLCLLVAVSACKGQPPEPATPGNSAWSPPHLTSGRAKPPPPPETPHALYGRYCALCHAADGSGHAADHASSLRSQSLLATASDAYLFQAIAHGRPGTPMSAWSQEKGGPLSDKDIRALITYLRSLRPGVEPVPVDHLVVKGDPEAGQRVYAQHCVSCHGEGGKGGKGVVLGHPGFLATASDGFIRHAIAQGRDGTPMPAFGERLSSKQLDDVTAYIRGLSPQGLRPPPVVVEQLPAIAQAVINPRGPAPRFSPLREGRYVPVEEVKAALDAGARLVLLDARPTSDWLRSHLPGALPVPFYEPDKFQQSLPRDGTWIISYCACPHAASGKVMDSLRAAGFTHTAVLDEGILVWEQRGYPLAMGQREPAPPRPLEAVSGSSP